MPIMGSLGDKIVFSVSQDTVNTLNNIKWTCSSRFGEHKRHMGSVLLEFTGNEVETITFDLFFSAFLGVKPMDQVKELLYATRRGEKLLFCIGGKGYGTYRWVIDNVKQGLQQFDNNGNLVVSVASVTLKSYSGR